LDRGREPFGSVGRDHAYEDDTVGIEEGRLDHGILQARGREAGALHRLEPEVGDEVLPPGVEGRVRPLVDEESLVAVKEERFGTAVFRVWLRRAPLGDPRHVLQDRI
jgi:hypothetical protein